MDRGGKALLVKGKSALGPNSTVVIPLVFYSFVITYPIFTLVLLKGVFIVLTIGILLLVVFDIWARDGKVWFRKELIPPSLLYIVPIFSLAWSQYPLDTLQGILTVTLNLPLLYIAMYASWNGRGDVIRKSFGLLPIGLVIAMMMIWVQYGSIRPTSVEMNEVVGSFANHAASMSVVCIPFLLLSLKHHLGSRLFSGTALCAAIVVIVLGQSRSGFALLIMGFVFPLFFMSGNIITRATRLLTWSIILGGLVASVVYIYGSDKTLGAMVERVHSSQVLSGGIIDPDRSLDDYGRAQMYATGIQMISEYPITGIGYAGLRPLMEERFGFGLVSHNIIITAWGELGLVGLVVYAWVFAREFLFARAVIRRNETFLHDIGVACFVALLVCLIYSFTRPFESILTLPIVLGVMSTLRGTIYANRHTGKLKWRK